ncbi:hypothetical protein TREMEDRAFT_73980 [Tremella mesenterica DSM 1558]|uniref:uncharacterized protein n=1 Tax=Tremella mesenterica (strain ATCC 24925 / CBS 8224 / DSM 1558 / NBRC 9311 / NRRL Y-6157 / RJB 2259-6 / UBC 559-6) TaxID=578456 RepID=UPI0003F491E7|nr:uncharacterized protein TREMEDRAFT_73980 [Tremella mesenterica DSM 1558]EIW68969.1 hypothetical protein TREMEDRAFT_73980 [Tremella mesenterica DSM 1558]
MVDRMKRKRDGDGTAQIRSHIPRQHATRLYTSGREVQDALAPISLDALVSFQHQIYTPHTHLPLPISHKTVALVQEYLEASPSCDEVFKSWQQGEQQRDEKLVHASVRLLSTILKILTPLPYFQSSLTGLVNKIISASEPYYDSLNYLIQSDKRDECLNGVELAAAALHVDLPRASDGHAESGRLSLRVWSALAEGGNLKRIGKMLAMRRRNKEGMPEYGDRDPLDRPDIRHALLHLILPMFPTPLFQAHARLVMPSIWSHISSDPPITVYRILDAAWTAITAQTSGLGRRTSLVLLNESAIEHLLQLLVRQDTEPITGKKVGEIVSAFLDSVTIVPGRGVCFPDEGWYPRQPTEDDAKRSFADQEYHNPRGDPEERLRRGLHNRILSNVVRRLGPKVIDEHEQIGDWVVKVLQSCPELVASYWPHSAMSMEPKLSSRWCANMAFAGRIVALPPPNLSTFRQPLPKGLSSVDESMPFRTTPPVIATVIESIMPSPLTKTHITKGLLVADDLVKHMTAITLAKCLQKLSTVQDLFKTIEEEISTQPSSSTTLDSWRRARRELELEARRRVPDVQTIITMAQKSATMAPADPETDEEKALAARSGMLTEVAMRLFRLYYRTMPSIASEVKFDPGRLLVSSSSVKGERRARKDLRSGSVLSDTGTVASVGTVGTVGMGGGFGHTRGDVQGFMALTQVHVLELLGEWQDWQWGNKASGSQYTYLYHVLQLHLATRQPTAYAMTTSLLHTLLTPTLLFEHDPSELSIWLDALPRNPCSLDAALMTQQIHLLSFFDDCVRRCTKTPYRYIDDLNAFLPDYFSWDKPAEMPSPLLMTLLEQLKAKVMGQHISTEAAGVVMNYLGRILLCMWGKQKDGFFISAVVERLEAIVIEAKQAGQARAGLEDVVGRIRKDMNVIQGSMIAVADLDTSAVIPLLADEQDLDSRVYRSWTERCFERKLLDNLGKDSTVLVNTLEGNFLGASEGSLTRMGQFGVHLACRPKVSTDEVVSLLRVISSCLRLSLSISPSMSHKEAIFGDMKMRDLLSSDGDQVWRKTVKGLVELLDPTAEQDRALAETYVLQALEGMTEDTRGDRLQQNLLLVSPWIRFMAPQQAQEAIHSILQHPARLATVNKEMMATISAIAIRTASLEAAFQYFGFFVDAQLLEPLSILLQGDRKTRVARGGIRPQLNIRADDLRRLIATNADEAFQLLGQLVAGQVKSAIALSELVVVDPTLASDYRFLPLINVLLSIDSVASKLYNTLEGIAQSALRALNDARQSSVHQPALEILAKLVNLLGAGSSSIINSQKIVSPLRAAQIAEILWRTGGETLRPTCVRLVKQLLEGLCRALGSQVKPTEEILQACHIFGAVIGEASDIDMEVEQVERYIISTIQDHLDVPDIVDLGAILVKRTSMKASFIRQQLQKLFDNPQFNSLSRSDQAHTQLLPTVRLIHALFHASPYASCQPTFIERLLHVYKGTLSHSDVLLLSIFQLFEHHSKISCLSILRCWSPSGIPRPQRAAETVASLDAQKVFVTCVRYPLRRAVRGDFSDSEEVYDPVFIFGLYGATLEESLSGLDWVEILRSNVMGLTICALSSRDGEMRALAAGLLSKTLTYLKTVTFHERAQLIYFLRLLRHSIPPPSETTSSPSRLPPLITLFFAHILRTLANPSHFLYPLISRFFLQRPTFDPEDVPLLFGMLYASGDFHKRERTWIIRFLRDGVSTAHDWKILQRRNTFTLLSTIYQSSLDPSLRRLILQAMESMTLIPIAAKSLIFRNGIIPWLSIQWTLGNGSSLRSIEEERSTFLRLVENLMINLIPSLDHPSVDHILLDKEKINQEDVQDGATKSNEEKERFKKGDKDNWLVYVESFLLQAMNEANPDRINIISRILFRLSQIRPISKRLLKPLINKTDNIQLPVESIELLFRAGLTLSPSDTSCVGKYNSSILL